MKIYRLAKSIQLPPQVDQQIRSILPLVNQYIEKAQKHSEPYVYDLGSINFVDPYTQQHRGIPIIVSNVDAETYQKPNAYAAYCPDEGPYGSIYIYMAQDMSTLYRALVHETIHAIDPKMSKDNLIANEKNKQYELQLHERDEFMGTVTN